MAADYKQSAADAQQRTDMARESSDRHSRTAAGMQRYATDAADHLNKAEKRQHKRAADKKRTKS